MNLKTFELPKEYRCQVEALCETPGARFELRLFRWGDRHEATYAPPWSYLEVTDIQARGRYVAPAFTDLMPQGSLRFFPAWHTFHSRWREAEQRSFFCALDIPQITGVTLELDADQLGETINFRNRFVGQLLTRAQHELRQPGLCSQLVLDSISVALAAEIVQHFASAGRQQRGRKLDGAYLTTLGSRVRETRQTPSLAELARELGVSPRQYTRLFHAAAGETLAAFCTRHVVGLAMDLLADRSLLVKEVAYRCGFADTAAFSKAFRRSVGISPLQYRIARQSR